MKVNGAGESSLLLLDVIKQLDTCGHPLRRRRALSRLPFTER
jgi:hypothetical protein